MRVLVTGGRGLVGRALASQLRDRGHRPIVADKRLGHPVFGLNLSHRLSAEFVVEAAAPDVVCHLAASPGRAFAEDNPRRALEDGVVATTAVAMACERYGVPLAYASTSEVYGDRGRACVDESSPARPTSGLYALYKLWGEQVCAAYVSELLVLRPLMAYGPGQRVGPGWAALPTFVDDAIRGRPITVHEGAMRSWCYVTDAAAAVAGLLESGARGVYNVGRDDELVSMSEVAEIACELAGASSDLIEVVPAPESQTLVKRISCAKLYATGWRPRVSLREGMRLVYDDATSLLAGAGRRVV